MTVNYQNPGTVNLVLDSETIGTDATTGQPLVREFVIPQESVSGSDALGRMADLLEKIVDELKSIRILLETDQPPGIWDELDEADIAEGREEATTQGIEEQ